jgi:hypothetical protein
MRLLSNACLASLAVVALAGSSLAQTTTAFTYQGELRDNSNPATGTYDLQFALFDETGTQIGATLCSNNVAVIEGRFTVSLDFGSQYANYLKRFLEIRVRPDLGSDCSVTSGFTTLAPRQELTATPYASASLTTITASNSLRLNNQDASFYTNASNLSSGTLGVARLPTTVARTDIANTFNVGNTFFGVNTFPGGQTNLLSPVTVGPTGGTAQAPLHVREGLSGSSLYNANAAAIFERNNACFLQLLTPDAFESGILFGNTVGSVRGAMIYNDTGVFDLRFRTDNATRLTIESGGDVGIGTSDPTERLHVAGNILATGTINTALLKTSSGVDSSGFTTANVVAGYVANTLTPGVVGATISGGGRSGQGPGPDFFYQEVTDEYGTIGGGANNRAGNGTGTASDAGFATVAGGLANEATGLNSAILGGAFNSALGRSSTVAGGDNNYVGTDYSVIAGGGVNRIDTETYAFIGGGNANKVSGRWGVLGGGRFNQVTGSLSVIGGGDSNTNPGFNSFIGGGLSNSNLGTKSVIVGGEGNSTTGTGTFVGGGNGNSAASFYGTVVGGGSNEAGNQWTFVGGGFNNHATEPYAVVLAGASNLAYAQSAVIVGGSGHSAGGPYSFIGAGNSNAALGDYSTLPGGDNNSVAGDWSACPGGSNNSAGGNYSFAAGRRAKVRGQVASGDLDGDEGTFIWADSANADFTSSGPNQFLIRASGGTGIGTSSPQAFVHVRPSSSGATNYNSNAVAIIERGSTAFLQMLTPNANESGILFGNANGSAEGAVIFNDSGGQDLRFRTNATNRMTIDSLGRVGINTTAPGTTLQVVGTITATTKLFTIDHPLDPEHKLLRHSCVESNEYKNLYDGIATTDATGYATITLPDWFEALNENFRYQLTIIDSDDSGDPLLWARVARKLDRNQFVIRTSRGNTEVSWQITGNRKDTYVKEHPLEVEGTKPATSATAQSSAAQ